MPITYLSGDATKPIDTGGTRTIIHICNSVGGWGAGFVLHLSSSWKEPEVRYRRWFREGVNGNFELGQTQFVMVEEEPLMFVANMIAQVGYGRRGAEKHKALNPPGTPPIRYAALRKCLTQVAEFAIRKQATIHGPRLGSGLAGGNWEVIERILEEDLCSKGLEVFIYDLPKPFLTPAA
jgi:hypothetical protein